MRAPSTGAQVLYNMLNPSAAEPFAEELSGARITAAIVRSHPIGAIGGVGVVGIRVLGRRGGALSGSTERHPHCGFGARADRFGD